jgi:hypothetical protein
VKSASRTILICLLSGLSGCATYQSMGEPVDDPAQRAALLQGYRKPDVSKVVFRTVIRWPGRELSLVEVVKPTEQGGMSIVGMTDISTTLFAVQVDPNGEGRVVTKNLPLSNEWLLDNLIADLLIPWQGPSPACQLRRLEDKTWTLVRQGQRTTDMFIFDEMGQWRQSRRLQGRRLLAQMSFEWDGNAVPKIVRIDNRSAYYEGVRERVEVH